MEARRDGEVSKGTEAQAEGKVEKGGHEGQREERKGRGGETRVGMGGRGPAG